MSDNAGNLHVHDKTGLRDLVDKSVDSERLSLSFHGFRYRLFNKISLDNMLHFHNLLYMSCDHVQVIFLFVHVIVTYE